MATFIYVGKTAKGGSVNGKISAKSKDDAILKLRQRNITPVSLEERSIKLNLPMLGNPSTKDLVIFTRTFLTMIEAGLPIVQAFGILAKQQPNKKFKSILLGVKDSVEQGATLADSLRKYPNVFTDLYCNLVEAGESGGVLDIVLTRLATFLEKQEKLRKEVKGAMTYPIIALIIAVVAVAIMLIKVIPTFEKMFADFGRELPGVTQMVIDLSHTVQNTYVYIILGIIALVISYKMLSRIEKVAWQIDRLKLKIPLIGILIHKTALTRFNQTLGTLLASGIPIVNAMEICRGIVGNRLIAADIDKAIEGVREGKTFTQPLEESKYFPDMMVQMVEVGETTGRLDQMLERLAQFYEEEVEVAVEAITSAIEPLMMVVLGGIVGSLLIAMYMPIFTIAGG